jgi:uncharacterized membrane protein YfcA
VIAEAIGVGIAAGILSGMFGVGGGIVFVPALVIFFNLNQVDAEATSLLAMIPVALVGAYRQHRYGNLRVREGVVIGLLSAGGGAGGVALANVLPEHTLKLAFAALTLAIAAQLVRHGLAERARQ